MKYNTLNMITIIFSTFFTLCQELLSILFHQKVEFITSFGGRLVLELTPSRTRQPEKVLWHRCSDYYNYERTTSGTNNSRSDPGVLSNILNTNSDCVWSHFQTPRIELKIRRAREYFWRTSSCLVMWRDTDSSVWYMIYYGENEKTRS